MRVQAGVITGSKSGSAIYDLRRWFACPMVIARCRQARTRVCHSPFAHSLAFIAYGRSKSSVFQAASGVR